MRTVLTAVLLALAPVAAEPYYLGLNHGWAPNVCELTRLRWALDTGCRMPRMAIRQDLFEQPGGRGHADAAIRNTVAAGGTPLCFLTNNAGRTVRLADGAPAATTEPAGLTEPIFAGGTDIGEPGDGINPANTWARFVHGVVERYDGDGFRDAPDLPIVRYYSFWNEPDRMEPPDRPDDPARVPTWPGAGYDRLARLVYVGRTAARHADPGCRVGIQLCFPESLTYLLRDQRHPVGHLIDFLDYTAYGGDGSDANCFLNAGLVPTAEAFEEAFRKAGYYAPLLLCSETGFGGLLHDGAVQRAAVVKTQIVGASIGLLTAQWQGLLDPSRQSTGLIRDVRSLPEDGRGWQPRDGYYAYRSLANLLGEGLADGSIRHQEALGLGNDARGYRFTTPDGELVVAWAYDPDGDSTRRVEVNLPLRPRRRHARYRWDYCLTGRPDEVIDSGADGATVTLGIDPEYFLDADPPPRCEPLQRPPAKPGPAWIISASGEDERRPAALAFDGDLDTRWVAAGEQRQPWWRIDFPDGPVTCSAVEIKAPRAPRMSLVIQVSDDGDVWRTVSKPFSPPDWGVHRIALAALVSSSRWRVLFENVVDENVGLFEIKLGEQSGDGP